MTTATIENAHNVEKSVLVFASLWKRFFARIVDNYLYLAISGALFGALMSMPFIKKGFEAKNMVIIVPNILLVLACFAVLSIVLEAFLISKFGATLGKFLLNFRIATDDGENLDFGTSLKRSALAFVFGCYFHIPLVSIIGFAGAADRIENKGTTYWDEMCDSKVIFEKPKIWGMIIIVLLLIAPFILPSILGPKPPA